MTSSSRDAGNSDSPRRLSLLASAISSRALQVMPGEAGEPGLVEMIKVYLADERS